MYLFYFFYFLFFIFFLLLQFFNFKIQFPYFSISFFLCFQFQIYNFPNSKLKVSQFLNSNFPIFNFKFLNPKPQIYKIVSFQFQNLILKFLSFKFITEFLISNISNYQFQNFNFKSVFKNSKHEINSIVPIKWDLMELICVTYKWAWVDPDISCILLINNLTSNL